MYVCMHICIFVPDVCMYVYTNISEPLDFCSNLSWFSTIRYEIRVYLNSAIYTQYISAVHTAATNLQLAI